MLKRHHWRFDKLPEFGNLVLEARSFEIADLIKPNYKSKHQTGRPVPERRLIMKNVVQQVDQSKITNASIKQEDRTQKGDAL